MAAHIALSRLSSFRKIKIWPTNIGLSSIHVFQRQINTGCMLAASGDLRTSEQSWVKKILRGSGPSEDVDDTLEEEDIVEIEPQYMDIIQTPKTTFIERPQVLKRVYNPPADLTETIQEITREIIPEATHEDWKSISLNDNKVKYQILSKCFTAFNHDVPNFLLSKIQTIDDVMAFYQTEVRDTTKFDELSTTDLPPNLKIHWNYSDDSRLELYKEHMDYVKPKKQQKQPEWKYRPS